MNTKSKKRELWPRIKESVNHGKPVYVVDARIKGRGERKFFGTRKEAEGWAQTQRVKRQNEETVAIMNFPEKLRIEALDCHGRLQPFKASLTDAADFFLRHAKPPGGARTAKALVDEFIAAKRAAGRRSEYTRIQASILGMFEKAFPDRFAHEVTAPEIETWLRDRGSLRTQRNYQFDVRNLFNFALKRGYVASNPVERMEKIILDEKPVEILTVEQASSLLEAAELAGGTMTPFVAIGLFADLRTREIAVLDWKDVDLAEKTITVHAVKTKTRARRAANFALDAFREKESLIVVHCADCLGNVGPPCKHLCGAAGFCGV
jgi:hypothetical protein